MTVHSPLGNPALHFELTRLAAATHGVCLASELGAGRLGTKAHSDMITRCRACKIADVCETQLALGVVPEHCPNKQLFEKLAG
ncbi:hypothetical protein DZK27_02970 [Rhodobacteraceae bacterium 63075]|nr:hypothetical protein DZK27_02970 [Rhodobacteraceae bacterium 63075]